MQLLEFIQMMLCKIETINITVVVKFVVNGRCYLKQDLVGFTNTLVLKTTKISGGQKLIPFFNLLIYIVN